MMLDERQTRRDMAERGHSLIKVLSKDLSGRTKENHNTPQPGQFQSSYSKLVKMFLV
jgi:hypothetical protein